MCDRVRCVCERGVCVCACSVRNCSPRAAVLALHDAVGSVHGTACCSAVVHHGGRRKHSSSVDHIVGC